MRGEKGSRESHEPGWRLFCPLAHGFELLPWAHTVDLCHCGSSYTSLRGPLCDKFPAMATEHDNTPVEWDIKYMFYMLSSFAVVGAIILFAFR